MHEKKENIKRSQREKKQRNIRMIDDFSTATIGARSQWNISFKRAEKFLNI